MKAPRKRKPRPEAVLPNLSEKDQDRLYEFLSSKGNTLEAGVAWARRELGVHTSRSAMGRFWSDQTRRAWIDRNAKTTAWSEARLDSAENLPATTRALATELIATIAERIRAGEPAETLQQITDMALAVLARVDSGARLDIEKRKLAVLETKAAQCDAAAAAARDPALSQAQREQRMRQIFGLES